MDRIRALRQQIAALTDEASGILRAAEESEDGTLTEDQEARLSAIDAQIGTTDKPGPLLSQLQHGQAQAERERTLDLGSGNEPDDGLRSTVPAVPAAVAGGFETFGEQLQAIAIAASSAGVVDPRLMQAAATGGSAGVPSDGGYLIQPEFVARIEKRAYDSGLLAVRCAPLEIGAGKNGVNVPFINEKSRKDGMRSGGVQVYWADEAEAVTATRPKIGVAEMRLKPLKGLAYLTEELLEDAVAMQSILEPAFAEEFSFKLDDGIFRGNGSGKTLGIHASKAMVVVAKEAGQAAKTVLYENISNMHSRLWSRSRANAVWLINQDVEPALRGMLIAGTTVPAYLPPGGAAAHPFGMLLGLPVVPTEYSETLGTLSDITLCDLNQYWLMRKGGLRAQSSMHVRFIYDEMTFKFSMRVNGQPKWQTTLTPFKGTNTQSPFVTLATRA